MGVFWILSAWTRCYHDCYFLGNLFFIPWFVKHVKISTAGHEKLTRNMMYRQNPLWTTSFCNWYVHIMESINFNKMYICWQRQFHWNVDLHRVVQPLFHIHKCTISISMKCTLVKNIHFIEMYIGRQHPFQWLCWN